MLRETDFKELKLFKKGKVRDVYDLGDRLLLIATDRISCFDAVLPTPIPDKGVILTKISLFWFSFLKDITENHLISTDLSDLPLELESSKDDLRGRFMITKKCEVVPFECVVRGYITGSGWKEYRASNSICDIALPEGLIVPVLKDADQKGLLQIAEESRVLVRKAREGNLSVDEVTGGTFTITNLSMFPVDGFTPILRPPESGILGLCRVREKPAVYNGEIAIRSMMTVSLTWDHRVVDGAPASEFLQTLCRFLEEPTLIMT